MALPLAMLGLLGVRAHGATIVWTNTDGGTWKTAKNWDPNKVPGASDEAVINMPGAYTVSINANSSVSNLTVGGPNATPEISFTANTLTLAPNGLFTMGSNAVLHLAGGILQNGALIVSGNLDWTKGSLHSSLNITPGGQMGLSGNNARLLDGAVDNEGVVTFSDSGAIQLTDGSSFSNGGLFLMQGNGTITSTNKHPVLSNTGTFRKDGASDVTTFSYIEFRNSGVLDLRTGGVGLPSGKHSFSDGARVTGPGSVWVSGGDLTLTGLITSEAPMELSAGNLKGTFTLAGPLNWRGGGVGSGATINGALNILGGLAVNPLTVSGPVNLASGEIRGGLFTINGDLNWTGGTISSTKLVLNGAVTWSGGRLSGNLLVPQGGSLNFLDGSAKVIDGGTLSNLSSIVLLSPTVLTCSNGAAIYNFGTFRLDQTTPLVGGGSVSRFYNYGTLTKGGTNQADWSILELHNFGQIAVEDGSLSLGNLNHSLEANSSVTGQGRFILQSGSLTLGTNASCSPTLEIAGGSFISGGEFDGDIQWSNGSLTGTLTVPAGKELLLTGSGTKIFTKNSVLNVAGSAELDGNGNLLFYAGATINNTGLFEVQNAGNFNFNGTDKALFNNYGTLRKTVSTAALPFTSMQLVNSGTLDIQAGDIMLTANVQSLQNGSAITGPGSVRVNGATLSLAGALSSVGPLYVISGVISGTATFAGALNISGGQLLGALTVNGPVTYSGGEIAGSLAANQSMDWSGGTISGTLSIQIGASLTVKSGGTRTLSGILNNAGIATVLPSGQVILISGTPVVNSGIFEVQDEVPFAVSGSGKPIFNNAGTFRKVFSTNNLAFGTILLQNTGTLDVEAGAIDFTINSHTLASGSRLTGPGRVRVAGGSVTMGDTLQADGPFELVSGYLYGDTTINGSFTMSGGLLPGTVTVSRQFNWSGGEVKGTFTSKEHVSWSGGTLSGTLNVPATVNLEVQVGGAKIMTGTLNNYGRLSLPDLVSIQLDNGCVINNAGLCEVWAADPFGHANNGIPTFINSGTFRKLGTTETTISANVIFQNSGIIDVSFNSLSFIAGTHTFSSGSLFTGAGLARVAGATINWNGAISNTCPLELASGTILAAGSISGAVRWSGGTIKGGLAIPPVSELRLVGALAKTLQVINLTNWGNLILEGSGALQFVDDAIVCNYGLIELQAANSFTAPNNGKKWLKNYGTFRKTESTQSFAFGGVQLFENTGTLDIEAGTVDLGLNSHNLNPGTQVTGNGALRVTGGTLTLAGSIPFSQPLQLNSGILTGVATNSGGLTMAGGQFTGTFVVNGPVLFSGGEIAGTLTANQTMQWSGGTISGILNIPLFANLTVKPGGTRTLSGVLNNSGTATVLPLGQITLANGTPVVNSGVFEAQDEAPFAVSGTGKPIINNTGIIRKTGSVQTMVFANILLQNSGTLDVQAGGLDFTLNSHNFANGSRLMGSGSVRIAGAAVTMGSALQADSLFQLASGYLYGDGTITGNFSMSGGQLPGTVTVTRQFNWSGGEVKGVLTANERIAWSGGLLSGTLNVPANCPFDLQDGTTKLMTGTLNNYGKLSLQPLGQIQMDSAAVINNSGLCETWSLAPFAHLNGAMPTFNNLGTFRKLGAKDTAIGLEIVFNNSGTLDVASNALSFISGTHTFNAGSLLSGAGSTKVAGATVNWNGAITNTGPMEVASGLLLAAGSINGSVTWSGGAIKGSLNIPPASELHLVGTSTKTLQDVILANAGSIFLESSGALQFMNDATIQNSGLTELQSANSFTVLNSGKKYFINSGTLRKKTSTLPFVFSGVLLQNSGGLDIQAGLIDFTLSSHSLDSGSQVTGPGALLVDGATLTLAGTIPFSGPLRVNSGILAGTATINGSLTWSGGTFSGTFTHVGTAVWSGGELSGALTLVGTMDWSGGTLSGSLVISNSSQLNILPSGTHLITGTLVNQGTTIVDDSGTISLTSGTPIVNTGTFELQSALPFKILTTTKPIFNNSGTLRRTVSTKVVDFGALILQNSGVLDLQSSDFTFSLNSHSFADGTRTMGAWATRVVGATLNVNGNMTLDGRLAVSSGELAGSGAFNASAPMSFSGGTISGTFVLNGDAAWTGSTLSGSLLENGTLTWGGGLLSGMLTIPAGSRVNVLGSANSISGLLQNAGTVVVSNTASILLLGGTPIVNSGLFEVQNEQALKPNSTTKANFNNSGILRKTVSSRLMKLDYVLLQNSGTLDLQSGELSFVLNSHNFNDGTRVSGTGSVHVAGATLNLAGTISLGPPLTLDSGYLAGSATLNGPFVMNGGQASDPLVVNGPVSLAGGVLKGSLRLNGAATWTGGELDAWFTVCSNSSLTIAGSGTKSIKGATLTNNGVTTVASSVTIQEDNGAVIQNYGAFNCPSGLTVTTPWGGQPSFNNYGVLSLTNGFGIFNFPGRFSQFSSGRLEMELAGTRPAVTFSQIANVPNLALDGALVVRTINGYQPALGNRIEIIRCLTRSGTFASYSANTTRLSPDYSPTNVTLFAAAPIITMQPVSQTVGVGTMASFSVQTYGTTPMFYQWSTNKVALPGATNTTLNLPNAQPAQEAGYVVTITNAWGSVTSAPAALIVIVPPAITGSPTSLTLNQGNTATFTVQASGTHLAYRWKFGESWLGGATNATLVLTNVTAGNAGKYKAEVSNVGGTVLTAEAVLTVIVPPTITEQPVSQNVAGGSSPALSVKASGTAPFSFQWLKDGAVLNGATNAALTLVNVGPAQAGSYVVMVANPAGTATSLPAIIAIKAPPVIVAQPRSQTATVGTNIVLAVTVTGVPAPAFQWRKNGVSINGAIGSVLSLTNVQPRDAGDYTVVAANSQGSVESQEAHLVVVVPELLFTDRFADRGIVYTATGYGHGTNFGATKEAGEPKHAGKGSATNSVWISWWAPANGIATFSTAGSDFDTVMAVYRGTAVNALSSVGADDDSGGFHCSKVSFNAVAGTYYQIAVAGDGATAGSIMLTWSLLATRQLLPQITQAPLDVTANVSDTVTLQVVFNAFEATSIQWFFQGQTLVGATNSTLVLPNIQSDKVGGYAVRLTGLSGQSVVSPPGDVQINTEGFSGVSARNKFFDAGERALTP